MKTTSCAVPVLAGIPVWFRAIEHLRIPSRILWWAYPHVFWMWPFKRRSV